MSAEAPIPVRTVAVDEGPAARGLRRLLLAILILAISGTFADLLFLDHYGDVWQAIPLALLGCAAGALLWHCICRNAASVWGLRLAMALLLCGGVAGMILHYQASAAFHTEMDSTLGGWPLLLAVLQSKAPPALAPANLLQLGLVGLASTYRHPALRRGPAR